MGVCSSRGNIPQEEVYDKSTIDIDQLEAELGDIDFVKELLIETKIAIKTNLADLHGAIRCKDYVTIILCSHSIKGIALSMKTDDIRQFSSIIEDQGRGATNGTPLDKSYCLETYEKLSKSIDTLNRFQEQYCA